MIVIGYQGIGKSTYCEKYNSSIDFESSWFKRDPGWEELYTGVAIHLSDEGYTVFTASHAKVREDLYASGKNIAVIFPSLILKEYWIDKLQKRYDKTGSEKDSKALFNAIASYDTNINAFMEEYNNNKLSNIKFYPIQSSNYKLKDIIKKAETDFELEV